jgi:hypothetical protein
MLATQAGAYNGTNPEVWVVLDSAGKFLAGYPCLKALQDAFRAAGGCVKGLIIGQLVKNAYHPDGHWSFHHV